MSFLRVEQAIDAATGVLCRQRASRQFAVGLRHRQVVVEEAARVVRVKSVVAARAAAELARAEAGVTDEQSVVEHRSTGIAEAAAALGPRIRAVLGELEHLARQVLSDGGGETPSPVGDGDRLLWPGVRLGKEHSVADEKERLLVQPAIAAC